MEEFVFDEDYTFPIDKFSLENINRDNENTGFFKIDKNIRYRIFNYISVDDNVSLSQTSKSMYLETREWFKIFVPSNDLSDVTIWDQSYYEPCHFCKSKNKKHVVFKKSSTFVCLNHDNLLYMCKSRKNTDKIESPIISCHINKYEHSNTLPNKGIYTYSFALHPNEYQPSGTYNYSRIDDIYLSKIPICWKCMYLLKIELKKKVLLKIESRKKVLNEQNFNLQFSQLRH